LSEYGSREWFDVRYGASEADPWGLGWRPSQMYRYGRMIEALGTAACLSNQSQGLVVDLGCATGDFTSLLGDAFSGDMRCRVVGVDLSDIAVSRARRRFPSLTFQTGSIGDAAAQFENSADLVTCLEVLYYIPAEERAGIVADLRRMLRKGGHLLVSSMIGSTPYMDRTALESLFTDGFKVRAAGTISLHPLVDVEKLVHRVFHLRRSWRASQFLPGRTGYRAVHRVAGLCRQLLGDRADSHAFCLAERI
jgi:SAM-dependent methyltransferase